MALEEPPDRRLTDGNAMASASSVRILASVFGYGRCQAIPQVLR
jgi:hypothetical protein